ncbi:hypothetical protein [Robbsia sp. KACC 23696]|uniref:hypothetical protein n=1 Tax=Robbsia sp. KACC 23696 TaxID=3149231 RepID=UPI00325C1EF7
MSERPPVSALPVAPSAMTAPIGTEASGLRDGGEGDEGDDGDASAAWRQGRDLMTLVELHGLQRRGAYRRRKRHYGMFGPGFLLAAQGTLSRGFVEEMMSTLNTTFDCEASVPLEALQFQSGAAGCMPGAATGMRDAFAYLRNMTVSDDEIGAQGADPLGAANASDDDDVAHETGAGTQAVTVSMDDLREAGDAALTHETGTLPSADMAQSFFTTGAADAVTGAGGYSASTMSPDREEGEAHNETDALAENAVFPDLVDGLSWEALTASAAPWADPADGDTDASGPTLDDDAWDHRRFASANDAGIDFHYDGGSNAPYCDVAAVADPLLDTRRIVSLVCQSDSPAAFEAATAAMPSMRCDLRARYRLTRALLFDIVAYAAAHYRVQDPPHPSRLAVDLERAVEAVSESLNHASTPAPFVVGTTTMPPDDAAAAGVSAVPDETQTHTTRRASGKQGKAAVCERVAQRVSLDRALQRATLDAIRTEIQRGVAFLNEALADLRAEAWRTQPGESGATRLSFAHLAEASRAAFRQANVGARGDTDVRLPEASGWTEAAFTWLSADAADDGDSQRCAAMSRRRELPHRLAATLLIMRFDMVHGLGVNDDDFMTRLLTDMTVGEAEPGWGRFDRLPTLGALYRYVVRLTERYENEQQAMRSLIFMPMKYYRNACFQQRSGQLPTANVTLPATWAARIRSDAYRQCFMSTDAASRERYHRQFARYRERYADRHARYIAETLLSNQGIDPLIWRSRGQVYDVAYLTRRKKFALMFDHLHNQEQRWQAHVIFLELSEPMVVCAMTDRSDMLTLSNLAKDGECQQQLDALTHPQQLALPMWLGLASQHGRFESSWLTRAAETGWFDQHRIVVTLRTTTVPRRDGTERVVAVRSTIYDETVGDAANALRQYVDAFEEGHYAPGTAEWLVNWLPFYGAIEKERGKDGYRVDWGQMAIDTAEIVMVLTMFGLPVKLLGRAALRAGRAAIRAARKSRLLPLTRAFRVLRGVLPYLHGAPRAVRPLSVRLRRGLRRHGADAWRSMRRFHWNRTASWRLADRARAAAPAVEVEAASLSDRAFLARVAAAFDQDLGMRAMMRAPEGMCYDAALLGRELLGPMVDAVAYRGILIWRRGVVQPANHVVLTVRRGIETYVLDPTAAQFRRFGAGLESPLYLPEMQWRAVYRQGFYDEVVKFEDFRTLAQTERVFGVVPHAVEDAMPSTTTLVAPAWYRAAR